MYQDDFQHRDDAQQGEHPVELLVGLGLPVAAVRGLNFTEGVAVGSQGGEEDGKPDAGIVEQQRGMIAGHVGDARHRIAGKVTGDAHQEEVGNNRTADDDGDGKDLARQQVGVDLVRESR